MKKTLLACAAALTALALPTVSHADLSFNVGAVTDYKYRGISQSRLKPAVQGGIDYSMGGFYVGTWASTIKWIKDAGGDASTEIDLYGGYKGEAAGLAYDVGVLTYQYPSNKLPTSANTTELYGAVTFGPATLKYSHSVTNLFGFSDSKNSGYLDLSAGFDVGSGITLTPHIGYQKISNNSDYSYTDVSVTASKDLMPGLTASLALLTTDTKSLGGVKAYASPANGKDLGKTSLILGLKYAF